MKKSQNVRTKSAFTPIIINHLNTYVNYKIGLGCYTRAGGNYAYLVYEGLMVLIVV